MYRLSMPATCLFLFVMTYIALCAGAQPLEDNPATDDVVTSFARLRTQGEWLAAHLTSGMPDSGALGEGTDKHYQGIQRGPYHPGGANNYLYVTRSGRVDDSADLGFLAVIQLGTRQHHGERFRSNVLAKGSESSDTLPATSDRVVHVTYYTDYQHPGGIQMVGDILAVPLETAKDGLGLPEGKIRFYDCSDPDNPLALPYELDFDEKVGVVGLIKLPEPDGHFLLMATGGDNSTVEFYRSNATSFFDEGFAFELHDTWTTSDQPGLFWPGGKTSWQSLNFIKQTDGKLYLMTCHNTSELAPVFNGDDEIALYEVFGFGDGETITMTQRSSTRNIDLRAKDEPLESELFGNLNGGGGAYVSPTGELIYYAVHHYDVPDISGPVRIRMAELRHIWVTRSGNCGPQFRANHLGGPYTIQEGETIDFDGTVYVVQPWLDMYEDSNFTGRIETMDYADQSADDYDDFSKLDGAGLFGSNGFGDEMSSFRWCGSPHYQLRIYKDDSFEGDVLTRPGNGHVGETNYVGDDFNDEASSAQIVRISNPTNSGYAWDLNGDGLFQENIGNPMALFGPGAGENMTTIGMRYDDITVTTTVTVENVPPQLLSFEVLASADEGGTVDVYASWRDAGATEHTATIDWGDGTQFDVNYGPSTAGVLEPTHVYADDGEYAVTFTVSDGLETVSDTRTVSVSNVAPTLNVGPNQTVLEGDLVTLPTDTFADAGTADTHTATVLWGDGTGIENADVVETPFGPPGDAAGLTGTIDASHVYAEDGVYTVTVCVTDDDLGNVCDAFTVTVMNAAPAVNPGGDREIVEGDTVTLPPAMFNDPGTLDTHTASIDWGDGTVQMLPVTESPFGPPGAITGLNGTAAGAHTYGDDGVFPVTVTVIDDEGLAGMGSFTVTVSNADPVVALETAAAIEVGGGIVFTARMDEPQVHNASADDTGSDDHEYAWTMLDEVFGDEVEVGTETYFNNGAGPDPAPSTDGLFPFHTDDTLHVTVGLPGVYTLVVDVLDDDGGAGQDSLAYLVSGDDPVPYTGSQWHARFSQRGIPQVSDEVLLAYLAYVDFASRYFSETMPVLTVEQARTLLRPGYSDEDTKEQSTDILKIRADSRERTIQNLLAAWLNVAAGTVDLDTVLANDLSVLETLNGIEDMLLSSSPEDPDFGDIQRSLQDINRPRPGQALRRIRQGILLQILERLLGANLEKSTSPDSLNPNP